MGLFRSLFGGRKLTRVKMLGDRVWISHAAKLAGIARDIEYRVAEDTAAVLVVAHFPSTLAALQQIVQATPVERPVSVVLARDLNASMAERLRLSEEVRIDLVVAERHLLPSEDQRLVEFAELLPCTSYLGQHLSIDDPLLDRFVGDSVRTMLEAIGMKPTEAIDSPIVTRRILAVQKKIAEAATGNVAADSAEEWLKANLPDG